MDICRFWTFFGILLLKLRSGLCNFENEDWVRMELSHAIDSDDPDNFIYRGNVTFVNLETGLAKVRQSPLTVTQRDFIRRLAKEDQPYRIKSDVIYANGKRQVFLSATKACNMLRSLLNDILWISIDNSGYVNAVTMFTARSGKCFNEDKTTSALKDFKTDVLVRHTEMAPYPDTTSFIQKLEREREARERGEFRDSRGFLAKYWMYIVPVVLLLFISGATNQDTTK